VLRLKPQRFVKSAVSATVVALLLVAEAVALTHPLDFDAHAAGEPCKICISVAGLGSAAVAQDAPVCLDSAAVAPLADGLSPIPYTRLATHTARGPPLAS
jgi:hypothetical protein